MAVLVNHPNPLSLGEGVFWAPSAGSNASREVIAPALAVRRSLQALYHCYYLILRTVYSVPDVELKVTE